MDFIDSARKVMKAFKEKRAPRPKMRMELRAKERPVELTVKNIGKELASNCVVTCASEDGRTILKEKIDDLYPYSSRDLTLLNINNLDRKIKVTVSYGAPNGRRFTQEKGFRLPKTEFS